MTAMPYDDVHAKLEDPMGALSYRTGRVGNPRRLHPPAGDPPGREHGHGRHRRDAARPVRDALPAGHRDPRPPTTRPRRRSTRCSPRAGSVPFRPGPPRRPTPGVQFGNAVCRISLQARNIAGHSVGGSVPAVPVNRVSAGRRVFRQQEHIRGRPKDTPPPALKPHGGGSSGPIGHNRPPGGRHARHRRSEARHGSARGAARVGTARHQLGTSGVSAGQRVPSSSARCRASAARCRGLTGGVPRPARASESCRPALPDCPWGAACCVASLPLTCRPPGGA